MLKTLINLIFTSLIIQPVYAEDVPAAGEGSIIGSLIFPAILLLIFYLFLIRPQQKKNKEQKVMLDKLMVGDEVVTMTGIYGIIETLDGPVATIKIAKNTIIQIQKHTVISPLPKGTFKPQ